MPRYFFDLVSAKGEVIDRDLVGGDFPDLETATRDGKIGFAVMVADGVVARDSRAKLVIRDPENRLLQVLRLDGSTVLKSGASDFPS